jgi:hypothetical protein
MRADHLAKEWPESLPGDIESGRKNSRQFSVLGVGYPEILDPFAFGAVKSFPDASSNRCSSYWLSRASRNSAPNVSFVEGEGELSSVESEVIVWCWHSILSTSAAGMRMSLPKVKDFSSPSRHISRIF